MKALALIGCVMLWAGPALAHDKDHPVTPQQKAWFETLKSGKGPCCGGPEVDGKVLTDNDWDSRDGHYRVYIQGEWTDVPDEAVLKQPNMYGPTMVWGYPVWNGESGKMRYAIVCFMPGVMG